MHTGHLQSTVILISEIYIFEPLNNFSQTVPLHLDNLDTLHYHYRLNQESTSTLFLQNRPFRRVYCSIFDTAINLLRGSAWWPKRIGHSI